MFGDGTGTEKVVVSEVGDIAEDRYDFEKFVVGIKPSMAVTKGFFNKYATVNPDLNFEFVKDNLDKNKAICKVESLKVLVVQSDKVHTLLPVKNSLTATKIVTVNQIQSVVKGTNTATVIPIVPLALVEDHKDTDTFFTPEIIELINEIKTGTCENLVSGDKQDIITDTAVWFRNQEIQSKMSAGTEKKTLSHNEPEVASDVIYQSAQDDDSEEDSHEKAQKKNSQDTSGERIGDAVQSQVIENEVSDNSFIKKRMSSIQSEIEKTEGHIFEKENSEFKEVFLKMDRKQDMSTRIKLPQWDDATQDGIDWFNGSSFLLNLTPGMYTEQAKIALMLAAIKNNNIRVKLVSELRLIKPEEMNLKRFEDVFKAHNKRDLITYKNQLKNYRYKPEIQFCEMYTELRLLTIRSTGLDEHRDKVSIDRLAMNFFMEKLPLELRAQLVTHEAETGSELVAAAERCRSFSRVYLQEKAEINAVEVDINYAHASKNTPVQGRTVQCFNCKGNHYARDCPQKGNSSDTRGKKEKKQVNCFYCGKPNHRISECRTMKKDKETIANLSNDGKQMGSRDSAPVYKTE